MEEKIINIIAKELNKDPREIKPEQNLMSDLDADSLDTVEIIIALEDEFGIEIDVEKTDTMITVQTIIDFVKTRVQ
jgi:acyl carrier protein